VSDIFGSVEDYVSRKRGEDKEWKDVNGATDLCVCNMRVQYVQEGKGKQSKRKSMCNK